MANVDFSNDYRILHKNIQNLIKSGDYDVHFYGKSFYGDDLVAFHKGKYTGKQFLITGGIHAREYISSFVVMKLLENYDLPYGCFFMPLLNPDGVNVCLNGLDGVSEEYKPLLTRLNNYSTDFSLWKANGRGVDLNVNFPALWGKGKMNVSLPAPENYIGESALSEVENISLLKFISGFDFEMSVAYHSKGEVVYYGFCGASKEIKLKIRQLANKIAKLLKYKPIISKNSVGGLSDYLCMQDIPSVTIELGSDLLKHPIRYSKFDEIYKNQYDAIKKTFKDIKNG